VLTRGESIKLAVEVVSTNWRDDYGRKLFDYEAMGIAEYWIVDFRALGARRLIGSPKTPTLSLHVLVDGEYQVQQFRGNELVKSAAFPNLNLTADQIFQAGF
jgi:Uma2 family endonuclease